MKPMKSLIKFVTIAFASVIVMLTTTLSPLFAASTEWHETLGGKLRLIAGGQQGDWLKAGLEISLDEGWKTYWKVPGDSGIPPIFDHTSSQNVADLDIRWPAPTRILVGGSEILGYKHAIIFPFLIKAKDPASPVKLVINAHLGLCSDLCVPLGAELALDLPSGGERDLGLELLIDRDLALVPQTVRKGFEIASIDHVKGENGADKLTIAANIPDGYGQKDLFVEAPEAWLLPLTQPLQEGGDGVSRFELELDGLPKDAQTKGTELTFTLTNGDEAVAQTIRLEK